MLCSVDTGRFFSKHTMGLASPLFLGRQDRWRLTNGAVPTGNSRWSVTWGPDGPGRQRTDTWMIQREVKWVYCKLSKKWSNSFGQTCSCLLYFGWHLLQNMSEQETPAWRCLYQGLVWQQLYKAARHLCWSAGHLWVTEKEFTQSVMWPVLASVFRRPEICWDLCLNSKCASRKNRHFSMCAISGSCAVCLARQVTTA